MREKTIDSSSFFPFLSVDTAYIIYNLHVRTPILSLLYKHDRN